MPVDTVMPIAKRLAAPAPAANTSGTRPATIAAVVIRIGRSRTAAARSIAARRSSPSWRCRSFAKLTIRIPCFEISPISVTSPICV
ncbi:Uncharacterised protein [Burkholderia pseudomallei]|nr:Uncharacterised protein [Burkholderia pseudomallei]